MATTQLRQVLRRLHDTKSLSEASDADLLGRFTAGREEAAFAALVRRHGGMVLGVARRALASAEDAEDVFQATFLVLARKAASIRKPDSVGSWLHGVAHRLALRARDQGARRRQRERRAVDMRDTDTGSEAAWEDVREALDAALGELPEKYRTALVLCYLEGKTHQEAARLLGCPLATLRTHIARGRTLLRKRLTARGLALSTAGLGALLIAGATPAAPAALVKATAGMAVPFAAGRSAAALCSPRVAGLVAGGLRSLFLGKAKAALAVLLAVGLLLAGAGGLVRQAVATPEGPAAPPPPMPQPEARPQPATRGNDRARAVEVRGHVLDPDGKPFTGAKVSLVRSSFGRRESVQREVRSGAGGTFRLALPAKDAQAVEDDPFAMTALVATAEGYGLAAASGDALTSSGDITLRLARDDVPIRGRIENLDGKPVPGVAVHVDSLGIPKAGDLSPWLAALQANPQDGYNIEARFLGGVSFYGMPSPFPTVTTDADGRFQLRGVGRERVVALTLRGPTIALSRISARTRPGKTITAAMFARNPEGGRLTYYGATFDHVEAPTRPVVGTVRDKDTGKPLAGVTVQSDRFAGSNTSGISGVDTVTDKHGRYRLVGMPKGMGNAIKAAPAPGQPYFQAVRELDDPPGLEPITADFALKRGVLIKGRVLDKVTRRPVQARVLYVVFEDNPHHKQVPDFAPDAYLETQPDGSFQLVAFPGRGILAARGWNDHYRMSFGADRIKGKRDPQGFFLTAPFLLESNTMNGYVEINPAEGAESLQCDIFLDPGRVPRGTVVGADGKPLAGARALGLTSYEGGRSWTRLPLPGADFTVYGLGDGEGRDVLFLHEAKHLAGLLRVGGKDRGPLTVKLEPWGVVAGRLVTAEGKPQAGVLLRVADDLLPASELHTDRDGRFRLEGLAAGQAYTLNVVRNGQPVAAVFTALALKAGETRDLGDVALPPIKSRE